MSNIFTKLNEHIREELGQPASLMRLLAEHPGIRVNLDPPRGSIAVASVVPWHKLGAEKASRGGLLGWKMDALSNYGSFRLQRPEYAQIGRCETSAQWSCDISELHGFAASKSALNDFTNTDQMVKADSAAMISAITREKLNENLAHRGIRIIHSPGVDNFVRHQWDGRLFLENEDGSHHLAAAKYIAARLPERVRLHGTLKNYSLSANAIASLRHDFEMFAVSGEQEVFNRFFEAMESFRATWLTHSLPPPFDKENAILLPKNEPRSVKVARVLRQAGIADLGQHLTNLASAQVRDTTARANRPTRVKPL